MSVLDKIRALDEQKAKLMEEAKSEALQAATIAIQSLNELGFHYRLVQDGTAPRVARGPVVTGGGRRGGVRDDVIAIITEAGNGIGRADILEKAGAKGDKKAEQSISNALANLKKAGTITANDGLYTMA